MTAHDWLAVLVLAGVLIAGVAIQVVRATDAAEKARHERASNRRTRRELERHHPPYRGYS